MSVYTYPPSQVSITPTPIEFNLNGVSTTVAEDTTTPANNHPMPSGLMIKKDDGNYYPVTLDTTNPYQHTPIPVAITDVAGTSNVTINAGDIQVGIKHNGADPSSVRIGDGTTLAGVTLSNELKTSDTSTQVKLDSVIANQTNKTQYVRLTDGTNEAGFATTMSDGIASTAAKLRTINFIQSLNPGGLYDRIRAGFTGAVSSVTGYFNTLWVGKYNATPPVLTDGQFIEPQFDVNGKLLTTSSVSGTVTSNLLATPIPGNTTTTPLGSNATFTGTWFDLTNFNSISLGVYADQNSATDGLVYQFSSDGITVHHQHTYTYLSSSNGVGYNVNAEFKYFRVVYTNNSVAQTVFSLISTAKQTSLFPSSYKVTQTITNQTQALFTRGVIVGQTTGGGGGYVNVKVNPSGALTADITGTVTANAGTNLNTSALNLETTQVAMSAKLPSSLGAKAGSGSLSIVPATDATFAQAVKTPSYSEDLTIADTAANTIVAPTGAKWCMVQADDQNAVNLRVKLGGTATNTSGMQFQPGRSESFDVAGNISVIAESTATAQKVYVTWGV